MTCNYESEEELALAGWSDADLRERRETIELARETAKADAYEVGLTSRQQDALIQRAEKRAREEAHDRFHRKLKAFQDMLLGNEAKQVPVPAHVGKGDSGGLTDAQKKSANKLFSGDDD